MLTNLFLLVVSFLCFALALSLTASTATFITDILKTILFSVAILRLAEVLSVSGNSINSQMLFSMDVVSIFLLVPSILIEIISVGFRSLSLGFRIFANIAAGHVLADIALVSRYVGITLLLAFWQTVFSYGILLYEFAVASIQLGVFIALISVYVE